MMYLNIEYRICSIEVEEYAAAPVAACQTSRGMRGTARPNAEDALMEAKHAVVMCVSVSVWVWVYL